MTGDQHLSLSAQTGTAMEFVADTRDIASPNADLRKLTDPDAAASLISGETLSRVGAVLEAHPGNPVVMLSGGVDSIFVAAAAVKLGAKPHAITVLTEGGTDRANAIEAAEVLGLTHDVVELDEQAVVNLARESVIRLGVPELWEVSYAIPLLATLPILGQIGNVGPILTGSGADAILAGGRVLDYRIGTPEATAELDRLIRKETANNFVYDRLVPDFYPRVMGEYADKFIHVFQTARFWEISETFAPPALFGYHGDKMVDKLCLRIACEALLPEAAQSIAWAKKSAIQRSAGIMDTLATATRRFAASLPGARAYSDPMAEPFEAVATRLFLAHLDETDYKQKRSEA
ncbi:asparagine synthase-related protein [Nocardia sp. NPDC052001]|uniref:asparagine synthase C-terminal domain-containing protein n=1 Tax=Nocardia sp. NPDC052001 TaxID=3154853 RepID=UPI003418EC5D